MSDEQLVVTDNPVKNRYEAKVDDDLIGVLEYEVQGQVVVFPHTEVSPSWEGRGVGGALARYALDAVKAQGNVHVIPQCSFVKVWIDRHPEYQDLLATER